MSQEIDRMKDKYAYQFRNSPEVSINGGWISMFSQLCERVDIMLPEEEKPNFEWTQVKSKFGGLRAYYSLKTSERRYTSDHDRLGDYLSALISSYESLSQYVCEECGDLGMTQNRGGWYVTACAVH